MSAPTSVERDQEAALIARATVWRALDTLTPRRRAIVVMYELEGLTIPAIASLLGITAITVRWHLSVGRRALARVLGPQMGDTHVVARGGETAASSTSPSTPIALLVAVVLLIAAFVVIGAQIWSGKSSTLQAAIRFEVRLAEDQPAPGLQEVQVAGSDRVVYLYDVAIVTNDDIASVRLVEGDAPSRFGIRVEFDAAGATRMRQTTTTHVGKPVAILIDGEVVTAPVVRTVISSSAMISGDYTRAEAARIVEGIEIR